MALNTIRLDPTATSTDMFTDLHTHILPNIDDGPKTLNESVSLALAAVKNGVDRIVATPHFYASTHGLEEHLSLAAERFNSLRQELSARSIPVKEMLLGYEVRYFKGISKCEDISKLCLNNSKVLLLELEPVSITEHTAEDIAELEYSGYTVLLAHLERYTRFSGFKKIKRLLNHNTILAQVNAESFLDTPLQRTANKLLKEGLVSVVASDMHSIEQRPPLLAEAFEAISQQAGANVAEAIIANGKKLFEQIK